MNDNLTNLMNALGSLFREKGWTLCVAESVTVGRLQSLIGSVSGASDFFPGGITTYQLEQKVLHLGVDRAEAAASNCVSPAVCREMSRGACALFRADVSIATTGYAEPDPDRHVEQPFAYVSVWRADSGSELLGVKLDGPPPDPWLDRQGQRRVCQQYFAESALAALLEGLRPETDPPSS